MTNKSDEIVKVDGEYSIRRLAIFSPRYFVFLRELNLAPAIGFKTMEEAQAALEGHRYSGHIVRDPLPHSLRVGDKVLFPGLGCWRPGVIVRFEEAGTIVVGRDQIGELRGHFNNCRYVPNTY